MKRATKTKLCKRCGSEFMPEWIALFKRYAEMCETCKVRNIFDGLDMKTPPELLDRHTKHPALTDSEFKESLKP